MVLSLGLCGFLGLTVAGVSCNTIAQGDDSQLLVEFENSTYSAVVLDNEATLVSNQHIGALVTGDDIRSIFKDELGSAEQKSLSYDIVSDVKNEIVQSGSVIKKNQIKEQEKKRKELLKKQINKHKTTKGTTYNIPRSWYSEFKAYMGYQAVTSTTSPQYKLLRGENAYTDEQGLRMVDGRYCIAMGSGFTNKIGTKIDLELTNGVIIPCILGDQKSDRHTKDGHMRCISNGSVAEFIIDDNEFYKHKDGSGTVNFAYKGWDAKLKKVTVLG